MSLSKNALFPATAWTLVRRLQMGVNDDHAQTALEALCRTYWEPVRRYLRALGCKEEEAADVTQDFFVSFLRHGGFSRADPDMAKLRTFIKLAARHFLTNHWRNRTTLRRGGGAQAEVLDDVPEPADAELSLAQQAYDKDWAQAVFNTALTRVAAGYSRRGKGEVFECIKAGLTRPGALLGSSEIAARLGIPESQVRVAVHRARQRLAEALREEVMATVENPADAEEEVRYLIGVIAHAQ